MFWQKYWGLFFLLIVLLPCVAAGLFGRWLRRRADIKTEDSLKYWEVFVKVLGAMTVVVTGAFVFGKYIDQKAEAQRAESVKHEAAYLERRIDVAKKERAQKAELFKAATGAAVKLANAGDPKELALASPTRAEFEQLYWASLIGVEEPGGPVERAMVQFRREVERRAGGTPGAETPHALVLTLAQACIAELGKSDAQIARMEEEALRLHRRE